MLYIFVSKDRIALKAQPVQWTLYPRCIYKNVEKHVAQLSHSMVVLGSTPDVSRAAKKASFKNQELIIYRRESI